MLGAHPASYTMSICSPFLRKSGLGMALTIHPHLELMLKKEYGYICTQPGHFGLF
jgi:hypothetical protein